MKFFFPFVFILMLMSYFLIDTDRDYKKDLSVKAHSYIEGLRIVNKKNGVDSFVIHAKRADFTRDETIARMEAVTLNIIREGIVLNADKGTYNTSTRDVELDSNIRIRIKDSVISANSLSWNSSTGALKTDGPIRVEGSKFRVEGDGLTATEDQKIKLMKNVKATFF